MLCFRKLGLALTVDGIFRADLHASGKNTSHPIGLSVVYVCVLKVPARQPRHHPRLTCTPTSTLCAASHVHTLIMAATEDKENLAPQTSSDPLQQKPSLLSPRRSGRKGRSKSIGPGSLEEPEPPKISAKDRRKSAFVPATKSILSKNEESEKAARRKSMMNRRVSFAPEATLHTWDIVEYAKDHTTSTDDTDVDG